MAQYLKGFGSVYKVLDFTDSISLFLRRMLRCSKFYLKPFIFREWLAIKRYESLIAAEFDECWVVSPVDKGALGKLPVPIKIIPNGVEPQYFRLTPTTDNDPNILFVGYMGMESIDAVMYFLNKIFPLIHASIPHVKFYIVGANPPSSILKLAQNPNIVVTGFVENLLEYYSKASVVVAPMRFVAGVQNKVLEAMAAGVPVVASSLANAGIGGIHAEHLFVADEPVQFAEYVIYLLQNLKVRARIGSNARAFIKERFSWHAVVKRVDEIRKCLRV
jgi:glycosyltransferase involved in cell wall biosynthesis